MKDAEEGGTKALPSQVDEQELAGTVHLVAQAHVAQKMVPAVVWCYRKQYGPRWGEFRMMGRKARRRGGEACQLQVAVPGYLYP